MTYANEVAREHISARRASGWSWSEIADEAVRCLAIIGLSVPYQMVTAAQMESAFATVWIEVQLRFVAGRENCGVVIR